MKGRPQPAPEVVERARDMRKRGLSLPNIARRLGVHHTTVLLWTDPERAERKRAANLAAYRRRSSA